MEDQATHTRTRNIGILLVNLGSPDAPTSGAVRRYLKEFLWDRRIVDLPRPLWWLILNGIILNTRPRHSARLYQKIWTPEGSPLVAISNRQARALAGRLSDAVKRHLHVETAMRYGNPSIRAGLEELEKKGCGRILILPLYPQYSATTTASSLDAVWDVLKSWRVVPEIRTVSDYHDHSGYIDSLAASVERFWREGGKADKLLMSFHGLPKRYSDAGDPYPGQCLRTAELLAAKLGLDGTHWITAFQSRFGREEWIRPYTSEVLTDIAALGSGSVDVICPGFSADCLETLEEIAIQNRDTFLKGGGGRYRYIPALNDRPDFIEALVDIVRSRLGGWIDTPE